MSDLLEKSLTPLMKQFWEIKNEHLDKVLLFRMGDFYEMFHDDAKIAAPILNIALTSRNKKSEDDTPMCGVPHHSIAGPIGKLLNAGLKVAICDQLEDPALAKGIVKRGVTRILSPGMVYDPDTLEALTANYVAAFDEDTIGFLDATTGEGFYYPTQEMSPTALFALLRPVEVLLTEGQIQSSKEVGNSSKRNNFASTNDFTKLGMILTHAERVADNLPARFQNLPNTAKRLITYAADMQGPEVLNSFSPFEERSFVQNMALSELVIRHLEILKNTRGEDRGSLFHSIQRTKTSAGARLLKEWLRFPLLKQDLIEARLAQVANWTQKPSDLKILRETLGRLGDVERRLAKISYTNVHVRDLISLAQSLRVGQVLSPLCSGVTNEQLQSLVQIADEIENTITEDAPLNMKQGGYINKGVSPELDELIRLSEDSEQLLLEMEAREKSATGISSLKVRYNSVFGYYIEITHTHKDKVPDHYKRKQTLANAERYVTQELHELETKLLSAKQKRSEVEERLFQHVRQKVLLAGPQLLMLAKKWSALDVLSSLAWLALEQKYVRPQFTTGDLYLENSRHPVVEQEVSSAFVPNTITMVEGECLLLTGPNMAGKSTIMRQVAVSAILAQMGSYVPATVARLPIFDQIFTRIGASDSLSEGLSTFMVEMKETAAMLSGATSRSLVVLDEVGRGTSTYDGMSLAQSILEFLVREKKAYTLFATHYHEITELANMLPRVRNTHMAVLEQSGEIRFLYIFKEGPANKSYGIKVAALAGLPKSVVSRASELLKTHEGRVQAMQAHELPLFHAATSTEVASVVDPTGVELSDLKPVEAQILKEIKESSISGLTPLAALNRISEWQQSLS